MPDRIGLKCLMKKPLAKRGPRRQWVPKESGFRAYHHGLLQNTQDARESWKPMAPVLCLNGAVHWLKVNNRERHGTLNLFLCDNHNSYHLWLEMVPPLSLILVASLKILTFPLQAESNNNTCPWLFSKTTFSGWVHWNQICWLTSKPMH